MFDQTAYLVMLNAAYDLLGKNAGRLGQQFCEGFMRDYDLANGRQSEANAQHLFSFVAQEASRKYGTASISDEQLFDIIGTYISETFSRYSRSNMGNQGNPFGGNQRGFGSGGFGGSTPFGQSQQAPGFLGGNQRGFGMNTPGKMGPGAHLMGDIERPTPVFQQPVQAAPVSFVAEPQVQVRSNTHTKFNENPLDEFPDTGENYTEVLTGNCWGDENPKNRDIVVMDSHDLKVRDPKYAIRRAEAQHMCILDNPLDVVKDFFKIIPESIKAKPYIYRIHYNHLDTLNIPTSEYIDLCSTIDNVLTINAGDVSFYKSILSSLNTLNKGAWVTISNYLVKHINRGIYLACRLHGHPTTTISIETVDDLEELLSDTFKHSLMSVADGRNKVQKIVESAIYNALGEATGALFTDETYYPTKAIKSSPAFPNELRGVYPDKNLIPDIESPHFTSFVEALEKYELRHRTYLLSRRSVVVTNILGGRVLGNLSNTPMLFDGTIPNFLTKYTMNHLATRVTRGPLPEYKLKNRKIYRDTSHTLEDFYSGNKPYDQDVERVVDLPSYDSLPVDTSIFAVQYGGKPEEYIASIDVFSTLDDNKTVSTMLAKRQVQTMRFV
jgi:hypothetical protein